MATTSYIYHALGLTRYQHLKTEFRGGAVYHHVMKKRDERTCADLPAAGGLWIRVDRVDHGRPF